ncbi:MAG: winged helix-turn-helix transcriptional regulator [Chloroflexota bacterium]|nr:MAG: winged helix-turn-helix transcriptional regulator [Chloroflexota bacterium]
MPAPAEVVVHPLQRTIAVSLLPVHNAIYSLTLIVKADRVSGLGQWVINTHDALTPAELENHRLVIEGFHFALFPRRDWPAFEAYLDRLESMDPGALRDRLLGAYFEMPDLRDDPTPYHSVEQVLRSPDDYVDFLIGRFGEEFIEPAIEKKAYSYVIDPAAMQALIVSHLRMMWERFLKAEWHRVQPMLADSVAAFGATGLKNMSFQEAAGFVTGQQLSEIKWPTLEEAHSRLVFVPSAHVGPYVGKLPHGDVFVLFFGARLPKGSTMYAPDLSRNELVVRLNALADDTRLRILRYVADNGEQRSQKIMSELDLTQSTASRQLTQLCAAGFLDSRNCEGAKCYSLADARLRDTFRAVLAFLAVLP